MPLLIFFISATALSSGCDSTTIDAKSKSCIPTGILDCVSSLIIDVYDSVCTSNIVSKTINPDAAQESRIVTCASSYYISVSADVVSKSDFANSFYKLKRPNQPTLKNYNRNNNNETQDFGPQLFQKYPWTTFNSSS